jgi:hypothetical protein
MVFGAFCHFCFFSPASKYEEATHYFVFSRFVDFGTFDRFLNRACPAEHIIFCADRFKEFHIWGEGRTPTQFTPGKETLTSVVKVNQGIILSPLVWSYLKRALLNSCKQFIWFSEPMEIPYRDPMSLHVFAQYLQNKETRSYIEPRLFNNDSENIEAYRARLQTLYRWSVYLSLLFLVILSLGKRLTRDQRKAINYFIVTYSLHCLAIGFLSEPESRYGNKLVWGFCFLALVFLAEQFSRILSFPSAQRSP